jgi:hypothetical protein
MLAISCVPRDAIDLDGILPIAVVGSGTRRRRPSRAHHVWMRLAGTPGHEPAGDAPCDQRPAGFEFRIASLIDQDGSRALAPGTT